MVKTPVASVIFLPSSAKREFRSLIQKNTPEESCALLFGTQTEHSTQVKNIIATENVDHSSISFSIDPEFIYSQILHFEKKSPPLRIVGIFHSHLRGTRPSSRDREFMGLWPVIWVIGSLENEKLVMNAFFPQENDFREVQIRIST